MKKILYVGVGCCLLWGCTSLTRHEQIQLQQLKANGITVDRPVGDYEKPVSVAAAGLLNILPGFGNFYLGSGNAAESTHWLYGFLNLLCWPISVAWGVPEAAIDANTINKRELLYYYQYNNHGKQELQNRGIVLE